MAGEEGGDVGAAPGELAVGQHGGHQRLPLVHNDEHEHDQLPDRLRRWQGEERDRDREGRGARLLASKPRPVPRLAGVVANDERTERGPRPYEPTPADGLSPTWTAGGGVGAVVARRSARSSSTIAGTMTTNHTVSNHPNSVRAR